MINLAKPRQTRYVFANLPLNNYCFVEDKALNPVDVTWLCAIATKPQSYSASDQIQQAGLGESLLVIIANRLSICSWA